MRALQEEEEFEIPMTPLIDMVFLLLVFFLVATNFIRKEMDQQVVLPKSEAGEKPRYVPDKMVINVRADGTIVVNGSVKTETELRGMLREFGEAHPDRTATLRGDGRATYQMVMRVFGICRAEGVKQVDLPVREPDAP